MSDRTLYKGRYTIVTLAVALFLLMTIQPNRIHAQINREQVDQGYLTVLQDTDTLSKRPKIPLKEHLIGFRGGFSINGVHYSPPQEQKTITSNTNWSLLYTYYHSLWGKYPYFGIQTGLTYCEEGYKLDDINYRYKLVRVPLTSQFHIDFWKMRLLLNLGFFAGYRTTNEIEYPKIMEKPTESGFGKSDRHADYGFSGGGGLAFKMKHCEFQAECNYCYSLSMLYNPRKNSNQSYIYTYPNNLVFSLGFFIHL